MMNKLEFYSIILLVSCAGFAGGHYHGKDASHDKILDAHNQVTKAYNNIFNDKIECGLTINPITAKKLK